MMLFNLNPSHHSQNWLTWELSTFQKINKQKQPIVNWEAKSVLITLITVFFLFQGCKKEAEQPVETNPIVLDCDYFETDQVLEDDPARPVDYIVTCVAKVDGNVLIKAGVVIEFEDDAGLNVELGNLKVEGTSSSKVIFTGRNKVKGSWRGIFFKSKSVNNMLDHAVVSYGGGNSFNSNNDRGNVICYSDSKISITNSEISYGKEHGINAIYGNTDISAFNNNTITSNDKYPVISRIEYGYVYGSSNNFAGNTMDYIFLKGGQVIGDNRTWQKTNVPYLIDGNLKIQDNESLTIEAGAELRFEDESEISVYEGGYLSIEGDPNNFPNNIVLLSGIVEQPGSWLGIINHSDDERNVIDYAEIAYAGGGPHNSNGDLATIVVWSDSYQKVTNTILRDAAPDAVCAIKAPYFNDSIVVANNSIVNIDIEVCDGN